MKSADWTLVFSALPDTAFFELVRHYIGPVATPFHKPELIARMESFLGSSDVLNRCIAYVDHDDALILSCITLHESTTEDFLSQIFPELGSLGLHIKLHNLEERLLIWKNSQDAHGTYALTPLGESVQDAGNIGPGVIIGQSMGKLQTGIQHWLNDNFFNAALNFLSEQWPLFRKEGGWHKKTLKVIQSRFPTLFQDDRGEDRILLIGRGLIASGLVERNGDYLRCCIDTWKSIENTPAEERRISIITRTVVEHAIPFNNAIRIVRTLTLYLPPGRAYATENLLRIMKIVVGKGHSLSSMQAHRILTRLVLLGELVAGENGGFGRRTMDVPVVSPCLRITPAGDITCYPSIPLFCDLALSTQLTSLDVTASYHLEKERLLTGLEMGVNRRHFFKKLETLSGHKVPDSLEVLSVEWETGFRSVSLQLAVVLRMDESGQSILEGTKILEPYVIDKPGVGTWILDHRDRDAWLNALEQVGIVRIPGLQDLIPLESMSLPKKQSRPSIPFLPTTETSELANMQWNEPHFNDYSETLRELKKLPNVEKLSSDKREIFQERLERRILYAPSQIRPNAWKSEVMKAKGLDYHGKIRLAEAALSSRNILLELTMTKDNTTHTIRIVPSSVEKEGNDHIIKGNVFPDGEEARYPIRKIGLLKRMKTSLF